MNLLSESFLSQYPDQPEHMNELSQFVFYRTYSRWLDKENRRETWKEAVARAVNYNVGLSIEQFKRNNIRDKDGKFLEGMKQEAEALFHNIFNLRQFLSGRTHWVGGADTGVAEKYPLANFNCSFLNISSWDDLGDLFYLLLVGKPNGLCRR